LLQNREAGNTHLKPPLSCSLLGNFPEKLLESRTKKSRLVENDVKSNPLETKVKFAYNPHLLAWICWEKTLGSGHVTGGGRSNICFNIFHGNREFLAAPLSPKWISSSMHTFFFLPGVCFLLSFKRVMRFLTLIWKGAGNLSASRKQRIWQYEYFYFLGSNRCMKENVKLSARLYNGISWVPLNRSNSLPITLVLN